MLVVKSGIHYLPTQFILITNSILLLNYVHPPSDDV